MALKVPHPGRVTRQVGAQILKEARTLAAISHPNVVRVYEAGLDGDTWWIATELIDGISLQQQLAVALPGHRQAAQMMVALLRATQAFHDLGIIHRDLKPGNILLDSSQTPHITDFGLASHRVAPDITVTQDGKVFGTYAYMSPEQAAGEVSRTGRASDIYSLGVVLYELLTGTKPFQASDGLTVLHLIRHMDPKPPRKVVPGIPRDLQTICLKALNKKPEDRYETAGEMADELQRFLDDQPILTRPPGLAIRFGKLVRRNRLVSAALTAVGVIAAALVALSLQPAAGTLPVIVSTSPPEARVSLVRYDPDRRVPHDSEFTRSGKSGSRFHLIPGLYRIRADTTDGRSHDVWRRVPESAARNSSTQVFPHASWTVRSGDILLPTITLWHDGDLQEPLVEVTGGTFEAGYESEPGKLSAKHSQSVRDLLVGTEEVTHARFRSVLNQPIAVGGTTYLQFVNDKYGERDADENASVSGYPVDVAILWCELAGVRLPTTVEWEFVATDRGQLPNPGTSAEPPERQPWNDGSAAALPGIPPLEFQGLHSGLAEFTDSLMLGYQFLFPEAFPRVSASGLPTGFRLPRIVEVRGAPPTWITGGNPPFEYFVRERAAAPMEEGLQDSDVEPNFRRIGWRAFRSKTP